MKARKYKLLILLALPAMLMQSCLKDQEDDFADNASKRLTDLINKTSETLTSSENGWALDYYFGNPVSTGGSSMALVFDKDQVSAYGELDTTTVYKSHWSMKGNNGAVLSFDSYNSLLHAYATPTASRYQGSQGDFEFAIDSVAPDEIHMHGIRNRQPLVLHRLEKDFKQYVVDEVAQVNGNYLEKTTANISGIDVTMAYDWETRVAEISYSTAGDTTTVSMPFTYTDKGIRFFKPVSIGGKTLSDFEFVDDEDVMENVHYNTLDAGSTDVVFTAKYPNGYRHKDAWGGDYTFTYYADRAKTQLVSQDVTLTYVPDSAGYFMTGFVTKEERNKPVRQIPIMLKWRKATGLLEMKAQVIESYAYRSHYDVVMWLEYNYPTTGQLRNRRQGFSFVTQPDAANENVYHWGNNGVPFITSMDGDDRWADSFLFICQYQNAKGTPLFYPSEYPHIYFIQSLIRK